MRPDYGYAEEDQLGKPRDLGLLKRLLPFLRPYRRLLLGSVSLVVALTLINLTLPYLSKVAIDQYIVPVQTEQTDDPAAWTPAEGQRFLVIEMEDDTIRAVVERHAELFEVHGQTARIDYRDLEQIPRQDLRILRHRQITGLGWVVVLLLVLVVADFGLTFFQRMIMERAGHHIMHDLRLSLFDHIQQQSMSFFARQPVARLVTRMSNDVQNMHELFTTFASMVFRDIFMLGGIAVVLLVLDWRLALAVFAFLPLVVVAAVRFSMRAREVYRALRVKVAEINARMAETIDGIRTIQTFSQESHNHDRFARLNYREFSSGHARDSCVRAFHAVDRSAGAVCIGIGDCVRRHAGSGRPDQFGDSGSGTDLRAHAFPADPGSCGKLQRAAKRNGFGRADLRASGYRHPPGPSGGFRANGIPMQRNR
jgi:ATP-binding cassette, subfamily B, multidrug efflux pump